MKKKIENNLSNKHNEFQDFLQYLEERFEHTVSEDYADKCKIDF